jgi:hypothetical protein
MFPMKKILSALLLASMLVAALASCASGEDTTTTTGSTTPAATTTTQKAPPVTETTEPEPEAETPAVPGAGLEDLIAGKTKVTVDTAQLGLVDFDSWNEETENIDELFDGVKTFNDWYYNPDGSLRDGADPENTKGGGPGKCGGQASWGDDAGAWFYFALTEEAKISAYVITTGNDNSVYTVRNPVEWTLYGTNDAEAFAAAIAGGITTPITATDYPFAEDKWTVLDYVYDGQVAQGDFLENGYSIDAEAQQSFKYYCWYLGYTGDGNFQACELELYK